MLLLKLFDLFGQLLIKMGGPKPIGGPPKFGGGGLIIEDFIHFKSF
jgi:hypothetical protein